MKKRILAIVFAVTMIISLAGCTKEASSSGGSSSLIADTSSIEPEVSEYIVNPLTGVENMKKSGKIVFLTARPETILERVKNGKDRPLLNGHMNVEYISEMMEKRRVFYEGAADFRVSTDDKTVGEICTEIIQILTRE